MLQVLVSGLRVRVRLDEERLTQLLRGHGDAATTAGLLACLGDLATVSFDSHLSGAHHRCDITYFQLHPDKSLGLPTQTRLSSLPCPTSRSKLSACLYFHLTRAKLHCVGACW